MASLKVGSSLGRCFLRGSRVASSTLRFTKFPTTVGLPHRQFASVSGPLRDAVPNNGGETQSGPPRLGGQDPSRSARSVAFLKLQSRVLPHEIESLLKEAGVNVYVMVSRWRNICIKTIYAHVILKLMVIVGNL